MRRPTYQDVATALATASLPAERERAGALLSAYYATGSHSETLAQRRVLLANALTAALEEERGDGMARR